MKSRILLFIMSILITSCITIDDCDDNSDSELVARFKTVKEGVPTDSTVTDLTLFGVREGLSDSLLYNALSTSAFVVPLDPHHDFSRFVLQIGEQTDTLVLHHHHEIYLISYGCGFGNLFTLDDIEQSTGMIKHDTIINDMVYAEYEEDEEHIWLYL
ncbi:MAG: hypothetical protein K8R52_08130 [Bacteroidales bacterium]|nr:hypothetical protein [Bacteroidales bacterium]